MPMLPSGTGNTRKSKQADNRRGNPLDSGEDFDLAIHGRGAASITRILIMEKVPTPGFINFQRDGTFANIYAGAPEKKATHGR